MKNVQPFMVTLENAVQRIDAANNRDHIEYLRIHEGGILRGYFLAGAICEIEYHAAVRQLQERYERRLQLTAAQTTHPWQLEHAS
jgi:hypothetical protein